MWLSFTKFLLGSFAIGILSISISSSLKRKELEILALEKETAQLKMFMSVADRPPAERRAFALYFSTIARDEESKEAWREYLKLAEEDIAAQEADREAMVEAVRGGSGALAETIREVRKRNPELADKLDRQIADLFQGTGAEGVGVARTAWQMYRSNPELATNLIEDVLGSSESSAAEENP